ncbi:MAG: D-isomer specific 2-hydroxyacid dehydrogenase family protein [Alistipes sp.]|nr:D-isomer specific 2-hydroxyacid dehydrogenase family protein [Alistipes sp.]
MRLAVFNYRADEEEFFIKFCEQYNVEAVYIKEAPSIQSIERAAGCDCASIITSPIGKAELDAFKKAGVGFVSTRTIGFDHIDMKYAKELGIGVGNVSYSPNSVAEYTIMLILMANRKAKTIMMRALGQDYSLRGVRGLELRMQTVGVVGTGQIGRKVIRNLSGFGCKIIAYDKFENDEVKKLADYVTLDELLSRADVITFHIPGNDDNYHMIDKAAFDKMKDGVTIINTARGTLIDTQALINAVECGKVGAAALDVVENEQAIYYKDYKYKPVNHREMAVLNSFPNVIMTPHTAFFTDMAVSDMVEHSILSCLKFTGRSDFGD